MSEPTFSHAIVTPPTVEPVTVQEAQAHLRIDSLDDEDTLAALVLAARQWCEAATNRQFCTATLRTRIAAFPADGTSIRLPRAPVQSITSVSYKDSDGDAQTVTAADYVASLDAEPAEIALASGASWPTTLDQADAITITYTAGYGVASAVPAPLKAAILLHTQILYDRDAKERESLEAARDALLGVYRVHYF